MNRQIGDRRISPLEIDFYVLINERNAAKAAWLMRIIISLGSGGVLPDQFAVMTRDFMSGSLVQCRYS